MKLCDIGVSPFFKVRTTCSQYCVWHCWLAANLKSEICATLNCIGDIYFLFFYISFYYNNLFSKFFTDLKNMIRSNRDKVRHSCRTFGTSMSHLLLSVKQRLGTGDWEWIWEVVEWLLDVEAGGVGGLTAICKWIHLLRIWRLTFAMCVVLFRSVWLHGIHCRCAL